MEAFVLKRKSWVDGKKRTKKNANKEPLWFRTCSSTVQVGIYVKKRNFPSTQSARLGYYFPCSRCAGKCSHKKGTKVQNPSAERSGISDINLTSLACNRMTRGLESVW